MPSALIKADGLHSYYGSSHVLHGVSFTVRRGEAAVLERGEAHEDVGALVAAAHAELGDAVRRKAGDVSP